MPTYFPFSPQNLHPGPTGLSRLKHIKLFLPKGFALIISSAWNSLSPPAAPYSHSGSLLLLIPKHQWHLSKRPLLTAQLEFGSCPNQFVLSPVYHFIILPSDIIMFICHRLSFIFVLFFSLLPIRGNPMRKDYKTSLMSSVYSTPRTGHLAYFWWINR